MHFIYLFILVSWLVIYLAPLEKGITRSASAIESRGKRRFLRQICSCPMSLGTCSLRTQPHLCNPSERFKLLNRYVSFVWSAFAVLSQEDHLDIISFGEVVNNKSCLVDFAVHFRGKCGGRLFDDRTCEFVMGEGGDFGIVSGLEYALKHFRRGERSRLEIVAKYGYGASGHREYGIPPNADLFYEVTMINFTRVSNRAVPISRPYA